MTSFPSASFSHTFTSTRFKKYLKLSTCIPEVSEMNLICRYYRIGSPSGIASLFFRAKISGPFPFCISCLSMSYHAVDSYLYSLNNLATVTSFEKKEVKHSFFKPTQEAECKKQDCQAMISPVAFQSGNTHINFRKSISWKSSGRVQKRRVLCGLAKPLLFPNWKATSKSIKIFQLEV